MFDLIKLKYAQQDALDRNAPTQPLIPVAQIFSQDSPRDTAQNTENITVEVVIREENDGINVTALALTILLYVIPITCIVYGIVHIRDCPAQDKIDISIIVLGGLTLVARFLNCPYECRSICRKNEGYPKNTCLILLNLILQLSIIGMFIALSYWIFTLHPATKPDESQLPNYCELQFYRNTFWGCVVGLVLVGILILGSCCLVCVACLVALHMDMRT